jgi:hypothetical protein
MQEGGADSPALFGSVGSMLATSEVEWQQNTFMPLNH